MLLLALLALAQEDPLPPAAVRRFGTVRFRDGRTFFGTPDFTPDGKTIVTSNGYELRLWEVESGRPLTRIQPEIGGIGARAFSPDGARLAVAGSKGGVAVLEFPSGERIAFLECAETDRPTSLAFSPDGSRLALGAQFSVTVWETRTWKQTVRHEDVGMDHLVVDFAPDGLLRAGRTHLRELRLWEAERMRPLFPPLQNKSVLEGLAFSRNGLWVASVEGKEKAHVWSLATGERKVSVDVPPDFFPKVALSPDGSRLAVAAAASLRIFDVKSGERLRELAFPVDLLRALALSPDGRVACIETDHALHLWRLDDGGPIGIQGEETGALGAMGLSADDRVLATRGLGIILWDVKTGEKLRTISAPGDALALSPRADRLYVGGQVWDTKTGAKIETPLSGSKLEMIQLFPDGSRVAGIVQGTGVCILDVATAKRTVMEGDHRTIVSALALSADGRRLAQVSAESRDDRAPRSFLRLYNTSNGTTESASSGFYPGIRTVAASPDGRLVAFGDYEGSVWLWRPGSPAPPVKLWSPGGEVLATAFSADGLLLASGGRPGRLHVWEVASARPLTVLTGHGVLTGIRFLSDGRRIVTISTDTTALLWDLGAAFGGPAPLDWEGLGRPEGAQAFWPCVRSGNQAVEALAPRLTQAGEAEVRPLLRRLDAEDLSEREAAMLALKNLGPRAEAVMLRELAGTKSPEVKVRLAALLEELQEPVAATPEHLRWSRAVGILERIGTAEARELLGAMGTRAGRTALERLKARGGT